MSDKYKAVETVNLYLAIDTFPKSAKKIDDVYKSGIRIWDSYEMKTYSLVIYRLRIMFGVKHRTGHIEGKG